MLYEILFRPFVRMMDQQRASNAALQYFKITGKIPGVRMLNRWLNNNKPTGLQKEVFGLQFYNPLGLAAGIDKHGDLYNDLNDLGFSFSQIGPLDANGVRIAVKNVQNDPQDDILAVCISADHLTAFTLAYDFFDFFVIDMTGKLDLSIVDPLLDARMTYEEYKPIVIKLNENISEAEIDSVIHYCMMNGVDGIEIRSAQYVRYIHEKTKGRLPIIAGGAIYNPQQALELLQSGADLIEIGSGFAYQGPGFVKSILRYLGQNFKTEA